MKTTLFLITEGTDILDFEYELMLQAITEYESLLQAITESKYQILIVLIVDIIVPMWQVRDYDDVMADIAELAADGNVGSIWLDPSANYAVYNMAGQVSVYARSLWLLNCLYRRVSLLAVLLFYDRTGSCRPHQFNLLKLSRMTWREFVSVIVWWASYTFDIYAQNI